MKISIKPGATRRVVQALFLLLFVLLFLLTIYPLLGDFPRHLFLLMSPLRVFCEALAARSWVPGLAGTLVILAATWLLGRFFCSWLCPLGAGLDVVDWAAFSARRKNRSALRDTTRWRSLKNAFLVAVGISAIFSLPLAYLLDPMALFSRLTTLAIYPSFLVPWKFLTALIPKLDMMTLAPPDGYFFRFTWLFWLNLLLVFGLLAVSRRFWCRAVCPLGALLAIFASATPCRRVVNDHCNHCGLCTSACPMGAIGEDPAEHAAGECIRCLNCVHTCPQKAIRYQWSSPRPPRFALQRRALLSSLGVGALVVFSARTDAQARDHESRLIRPPAALPEKHFTAACIRCGACMKVCVTNGLQPVLLEAGLGAMWTPRLVPTLGYCEQMCDYCARVCPSGAIQPFAVVEKPQIFIGTAVIDQNSCIAWNGGRQCLICDEHCSYKAVYWKEVRGERKPFVDEKVCVGCGICENKCPIQPGPAIVVYSFGEKRMLRRTDADRPDWACPGEESTSLPPLTTPSKGDKGKRWIETRPAPVLPRPSALPAPAPSGGEVPITPAPIPPGLPGVPY